MLILGIDPGTESPGYAAWSATYGQIVWAGTEPLPHCEVIVVEAGWPHGPMGKVQMWGLGWRAAWQVRDALAISPNAKVYQVKPKAWRAALGGLPANAPKAVIVARLRQLRYKQYVQANLDGGWTDDIVEACGIAEATAILLARKFKKDRIGLTEVKR